MLRVTSPAMSPAQRSSSCSSRASRKLDAMVDDLLRPEARAEAGGLRAQLDAMGASDDIVRGSSGCSS